MYFPYLRGRQFELIALRELLELKALDEQIIPLIEPVKLSSTLTKTLAKFIEEHRQIAVIHNPQVGSFPLEAAKESILREEYNALLFHPDVIKSHIVNRNSHKELSDLMNKGIGEDQLLTITCGVDDLEYYENGFGRKDGRYNLISDDRTLKRTVKSNRVILEDRFTKMKKNSDYQEKPDEFYSNDHLYFREEGYIGFADYSVAGKDYTESGFAPYAVAIHIVYFDSKKDLRIKHFVSDSNDDYQDPAGKFYEALQKLVVWSKENNVYTCGLQELIKHYENQTYPGLGTVKKLAIMHHMELMSQFFRGEI